jgi:eukaryotic-like serine/threonine-protein kinase
MPAKTIGRFEIIQELGRGAQGVVYLAHDSQLERHVAIKTLPPEAGLVAGELVREARISSNFLHPNIVTLYDAGEHEGMPYLVYAYVEGSTLSELIRQEGTLPLVQAAQIASGVLDGLTSAHEQGVMHLDIKPANIMITSSGQPMVMDFGIARAMTQQYDASGGILGTPQYMAPECFAEQGPDARSDLFSVGMVLYKMVTGVTAVERDDVMLNRHAYRQPAPPSSHNERVDRKLEAIILKSIAREPDERYPDAAAMRHALQQYLNPEEKGSGTAVSIESHSTLGFLLRRMRSNSDFPVLSNTISEINRIVASESASVNKLTQVILQDFALTNKLLRLVNTVSYGHFGGNIHTISKAATILGFDAVRNIATSLVLLELLQNKPQAEDLKEEIATSLLAGTVATRLVRGHGIDFEEARICAMFQNLGKMLAIFYFFEESQQIARLSEDQGISEEKAAVKVLGLSYNDLGTAIAKVWNLPSRIIAGMQKLPGEKIKKPHGKVESTAVAVNLATELCTIAAVGKPQDKKKSLAQLCRRYVQAMPVSERELSEALGNGLHELSKRAAIIGFDIAKNPLLNRVAKWNGHIATTPDHAPQDGKNGLVLLDTAADEEKTEIGWGEVRPDTEAMLSAGIQDVTNTLVEDFELNDVLQVVVETIYRSLDFRNVLILIRDDDLGVMAARSGFGEAADIIIPRFRFPLKFMPDVFHLAIDQGLDIVIEDAKAANIADKIPAWFRNVVDSQCFLILPIMVNKRAVGLIYADMQKSNTLKLTQRQLSLLRTLRNQAILAIRQKI